LSNKKKAERAAVAAREKQKKDQAKAKQLKQERIEKDQKRREVQDNAKREKIQREKEQQALKAAERKRQDALEKAEQEKLLAEQLQTEQAARQQQQQQQRSKQVLSEVQKYQALITQVIQRNWITDDSMKGKFCRLNIRLASNGLVIQVKELAGDTIVCRSAKAAVLKSDTLPVSKEADVYQELKDINLTVRPEL
ncbi:MAG: colicin import membrane protein, partial [Paraglaciecola sp.]